MGGDHRQPAPTEDTKPHGTMNDNEREKIIADSC
jgi:hypothetical protein